MTLVPTDPRGSLVPIIVNQEGLYEGNLVEYFQALFHLGKGLNLPYHNFRHTTGMVFVCHEGARFHQSELSPRQIRNMLIADFFHDFNHRGVAGDDAMNLELAFVALQKYILPIDRPYLPDIKLLMRGTQFPYVIANEELPLEGLIIRDADMMQAFSPSWLQQVVFGLAAEWGQTPIEVLKMQPSFLGNLKFNTRWGNFMFPPAAIALKVSEAQALYDILVKLPASHEEIREKQDEAA